MSYQSFFDSEYKHLPDNAFTEEQLESIRKCIKFSSHDGSGSGNLYTLRDSINAFMAFDVECFETTDDLHKLTLGEWQVLTSKLPEAWGGVDPLAPIGDKPIYNELRNYTLPDIVRITHALILTVTFRPFTALQGTPDEWFDHGDGRSYQNKRFGSVFKERDGSKAYWLDRFSVAFPSDWSDHQKWVQYRRSGEIDFPFNNEATPELIPFTDETMRMRAVQEPDSANQFLVQAALLHAAGQPLLPEVYSVTEEITPELGAQIIELTTALWAAVAVQLPEPTTPYARHMDLLDGLRWVSYHDSDEPKPEVVDVYGVVFSPDLIRHISRAVAFIPPGAEVVDGAFRTYAPNQANGHLALLPVYHVNDGYTGWSKTELVSLRWVDVLFKDTAVYHVSSTPGRLTIIPGDQEDWLWHTRSALNIPHPERKLMGGGEIADQNCDCPSDFTDPADPLED